MLTVPSEESYCLQLVSFPSPHPASRRLQYGKVGESLVHFLTWVTSQTWQIMRTWATCKPQKLHPHTRTRAWLFRVERRQRTKALAFYVALHETVGRTESFKTVKTHSNNLIVLAHVQLKSFYRLSIHDITHVRKCTRPSPALLNGKLGEGLGTRLVCYITVGMLSQTWVYQKQLTLHVQKPYPLVSTSYCWVCICGETLNDGGTLWSNLEVSVPSGKSWIYIWSPDVEIGAVKVWKRVLMALDCLSDLEYQQRCMNTW